MRRTFLDILSMKWLLPDPLVGAMLGFVVSAMAAMNLDSFGIVMPSFVLIACGVLGGIAGCVVGVLRQGPPGRGRTVAWWCATMTVVVGVGSFLIGFIGPMLLDPHSPQGPMLGIFVTGPLGGLAGAVCGVVIGLVARKT